MNPTILLARSLTWPDAMVAVAYLMFVFALFLFLLFFMLAVIAAGTTTDSED